MLFFKIDMISLSMFIKIYLSKICFSIFLLKGIVKVDEKYYYSTCTRAMKKIGMYSSF